MVVPSGEEGYRLVAFVFWIKVFVYSFSDQLVIHIVMHCIASYDKVLVTII